MGYWKEYAENVRQRGYEDSDKFICAGCVGDKFFYNVIRKTGSKAVCSFCRQRRNVLPMNDILEKISNVINRDYLPAYGNAIYDSEEDKYLDPVIDPYDFVFNELNQYLESDNEEFLKELFEKLSFDDRMSVDVFRSRQEEIDLQKWRSYCDLVKETPLSAEQIVSLINPENKKEIPSDLEEIQAVLEMVYEYCEEFKIVKAINGIHSSKDKTKIYRCVNFLPLNSEYAGFSFIPATLVGTAPAKAVADGRMSEKGDMMFYGANDEQTAITEVGKNEKHKDYPSTIGTFYSNKQIRILDLSELGRDDLPSVFDIQNERKRSTWFFLTEFMQEISKTKDFDDDKFYKPTQVFTKYVQRNTDLKGIKFKSSKTNGNCYVLFVENRDCLDDGDKTDRSRNQLIMKRVKQVEFI